MRAKLLGLAAALLLGLGTVSGAGPAQAAGKLNIYNWFDYMPQELIDKFAKEHDVLVMGHFLVEGLSQGVPIE